MDQTDHKPQEEYPSWIMDENGEPIIYQEWTESPTFWTPTFLQFII